MRGVAHVAKASHTPIRVDVECENTVSLQVLRCAQLEAQIWLELQNTIKKTRSQKAKKMTQMKKAPKQEYKAQ